LALTVLPAIARTQPNVKTAQCQNNLRQLIGGWRMYAEDNLQKTINNFGVADTISGLNSNWVNNVMSWSADSKVTNTALLKIGPLAAYTRDITHIFKCPADNFLSPIQRAAGFTERARSFAMNGFFGPFTPNSNDPWSSGRNTFLPNYRQWLKVTDVGKPDRYFVIIEEHPDSINDGLFINNPISSTTWGDIPGAFHNGAASLSFADGHAEVHEWKSLTTKVPVGFGYLTRPFDAAGHEDYQWLMNRMAVLF
jgi:prepilin-type processing-associated H-X9-DG protein